MKKDFRLDTNQMKWLMEQFENRKYNNDGVAHTPGIFVRKTHYSQGYTRRDEEKASNKVNVDLYFEEKDIAIFYYHFYQFLKAFDEDTNYKPVNLGDQTQVKFKDRYNNRNQ